VVGWGILLQQKYCILQQFESKPGIAMGRKHGAKEIVEWFG